MNENELLKQIAAMFRENISTIEQMMSEKIDAAKSEIMTTIEQTVVKRIDSLFDGYVSTRERQELMQTQMDSLASRVDTLELMVKKLGQVAS